ncbi:mucin-5AC-like isoform X3 [Sphaeramia orbicularis]|uniref:mucin-5AC-like isoform X3 n=1 Tax=Sphaeramia orbicularis TaxID=375764 RepID=UPI00117CA56B|nr:mucin-5AC-like isoform X3 [Sphaeramia orbicularis]
MRLTARCIFGTLLAVSSLSWITAASGEEDFQEDKGFEPCAATLTPEGPCKHEEETTCPYLVTLPLLTINLPMRLRELEQILEDLQKLKDNVDQLRKICADCTVSQTERECGSQTEREHEKLHEDIDTREDGMILMNETNAEIQKENERDLRHECGINRVKTENTAKSDGDTASEKRDSLKENERKTWDLKRETSKTVVKENEKEETLREVPEKDGKTHRKVDGVKGKGKLVQTQVPTAGKNEGRVEREEVVDKNHEETETDRNKVDNSKGSQEDTSEKKHPSKVTNREKTEESDHHVWQDETKETGKKTQTEDDRTGDRIKMSVDDDEHTNEDREQHREERKKEMAKEVKTQENKEKPKQTEDTQLTKKEKIVKEGEDREKEKKTKTGGEKTVQGEQSSSDGDLKNSKAIERTDLFSDSLTPHSTTDLTSSPKFTDLDKAVTFTSSPSLSSPISHFITDVDEEVKKTANGLKSKSTNFMDAGSTEYPNFDSDSGFRTTSRPATATPTISPLEDTGQKANGATIRFTSTTKDKGSSTKTTLITTTPRQTYTTTFSAVTDHSRWTSKKNISSPTKTGGKHTQSQGPKPSEKHKPGIKPEADQTLKHPKNDRKLVQAPLPDKKTNNDQRQKPPHQKPTTDQKSTSVKSPKPVQIPKHNQRPQLHNLPIDEDQKNEQILKNDQVQTTGQNELPTQKPKSHDKALPPVQKPTSQKKLVALNTTNYKDPATEQQPISDEIITQSPSADKITIHPPKVDRPDQRKDPDKKLKSEDNVKSDGRSNEYFTPVGKTESEINPMSSVTPNPNESTLNEFKENDQNPSLEPNASVRVSTPGPKPASDRTDPKLKPKPSLHIPKISQKPKPGQNITKIIQKPKPGQNITKIIQKPKHGQNITKIIQKPKHGQNITKIIQKPKPGQNITKIIQKPKPGQNITKINQKPKPGQNITKINQKLKPGQNITKITQKPKPDQAPKDKFKTSDLDQIPEAESNTTLKRWPSPELRPSTRPTINPGATPAQKLKPAVQSESTPKTKTDLDPTFISGVASESTHDTETGIQPTSGPIKQSTGVTHSQRGTEFSPSDRKPSPLGPKTSNTMDPDPFPHLSILPEGFTLSPTGRIKSDLRTQTTIQPPSILWTTRPKTVIGGSSKSLISSTTPGSTSLSSNTDSKSQSKIFDNVDEIASSQTTTRDKTTTSVPYSNVQTTSTVSSDFRSNQYFIPIEKTESETSTSSVTPNPNENHVSEFKEKDQSPSAESNISVQDSTSGQKPTPDRTDTNLKLKPNQRIPNKNQKPKPGQNVTKIIQKPKPGQKVTKIIQKPKPGQNVPKINQKPIPGQNVPKIDQKPKPGQVPKINQKHPKFETDQKTKLKPKPEQAPKDKYETPEFDQIPEGESNTTPKQWPSPGLRPPTRPVFSPVATPAPKLKPAVQSESTAKTKTDLNPTFISGVASESTHDTETGIQPTSGPIKQNTEVTHSQRGTEFSPSDRKPSPLGPKTSNTLDPDPFPHLNTLPEGFTLSPTGRIKSDLRTQTTAQSLLIPGTTRSNTIFGGTLKSLMSSTTLRSTSLASNTDSKSQSKIFDKVDEIESSWTTTADKTTTSVPFPRVQTTYTVSSDFRSTTTPTSASKSNQYFIPFEKTEIKTSTSSITPNPNENLVNGLKEKDENPSLEPIISVQDSTSGQKPTPGRSDAKLKPKPNQQMPKINQRPVPGQNVTKINQKPKPGQNITKIIQKPKPGQNVPKINQKPKPGQNITKIIQKPKPGQNITKIIQKPKTGQNITKIIQKPKHGQNITKIIQKPKPGQDVPKINQKPKPGQDVPKINQKPKPGQVPKINQKRPKFETDQKTKLRPEPEKAPKNNFETSDHDQIPEGESNTTSKQWPSPGLRPSTRPVFSPDATPASKPKPAVQSESTPKTKTDLDPTFISGVASESTHDTETGIQPTSGPIKQSTEVTHSQRGTEFSPSDRKPSPLGPKTSNTLDPDAFPHLNTLPEGFPMSPTGRIKSDLRPQTTIQPPSILWTTRPKTVIGGTVKSLTSSTTPRSTHLSSNTDSKSQSVLENVKETASSQTTTPDKTTTSVPPPSVQTTSTVSSGFRSTTTTSGPEAPAEASTPTARELRVKINQVAAFLNNSINPKLRPSDTTSKDHPDVDGRGSTFSTLPPKVIRDCSDHLLRGKTDSGVYLVTPDPSRSFSVLCDMELNGGGWTVLQRRKDGTVNFNRLWDDYKDGFGDINGGEFWLGNNLIHLLTRERDMMLRVELEDFDGVTEFAEYEHFKVASERMRFRLTVSGYSGTAGDALRFSKRYDHNNRAFTTPDRDHDRYPSGNCGAYYSSGWWFDACMAANLNGKYYSGRYKGVRDGIFWGTWHNISTEYYPTNERQSFRSVRMMIRPKGFKP